VSLFVSLRKKSAFTGLKGRNFPKDCTETKVQQPARPKRITGERKEPLRTSMVNKTGWGS
jgi:hypothetical protein